MGRCRGLWGLLLALVLAGCGSTSTRGLRRYQDDARQPPVVAPPPAGETVEVDYLGVSGIVLRRGQDALMFAPSITNPSLLELFLTGLHTDTRKVDRCMRHVPPVLGVEWVLAGHAHYDHLMDVPYLMARHAPFSRLLGSSTVSRTLASVLPKNRRVVLDACLARDGAMGRWFYNRRRTVRVMPIQSEHSPHLLGLDLLPGGSQERDLPALPGHVLEWKSGPTYAYLVDFLQGDRVVFRVHFQDAASNPERGFVPEAALREHPVDLAILCVGASDQVAHYPEAFLGKAQPRHILLGHWEDFFGNDCDRPPQVLRTFGRDQLEAFIDRVLTTSPRADVYLPRPFTRLRIPLGPPVSGQAVGEECTDVR